jgi:ribose 5-phosphate isomerase A
MSLKNFQMELKKQAAAKAITLVRDKTIIGLGAGSTIAHTVEFLKHEIEKGLQVRFATSSSSTLQLLLKNNFTVLQPGSLSKIDIYFDGCDQVDKDLNALKSGGGIHTHEKLLASMADEFVLMGDETKFVERFDNQFPVVIEVIPEAAAFVRFKVEELFPYSRNNFRISDKKDGYVITDNGNYLLDLWFEEWPDLAIINPVLKTVTGVVETSLFYKMADKAIIATEVEIRILSGS